VQLELLDVQRFRILSHFEAPIVDQEFAFARYSAEPSQCMIAPPHLLQAKSKMSAPMIDMIKPAG